MTAIPKRNFTAGEISPAYHGSIGTPLYNAGAATVRNWFGRKDGGLWRRTGFEVVAEVKPYSSESGLSREGYFVEFNYNPQQTYLLELGDLYMRIIDPRRDRYVYASGAVERPIVSITFDYPNQTVTVEDTAHPYADGDMVYIEGIDGGHDVLNHRCYFIEVVDTDNIKLLDPATGAYAAPLGPGGSDDALGTISKVLQYATPWPAAVLSSIQDSQDGPSIIMTASGFPTMVLTRAADDVWVFEVYEPVPATGTPQNLAAAPGGTGAAYKVAAVDATTREEGLPSDPVDAAAATVAAPQAEAWDEVYNAGKYNLYKQDQPGGVFGWIATVPATGAPTFTDDGLVPDYTRTPYRERSPFTSETLTLEQLGALVPSPGAVRSICFHSNGLIVLIGTATAPYFHAFKRQTTESEWVEFAINYKMFDDTYIQAAGLVYPIVGPSIAGLTGAVRKIVFTGKYTTINETVGSTNLILDNGEIIAIGGDFGDLSGTNTGGITYFYLTNKGGVTNIRWVGTMDVTETISGVSDISARTSGSHIAITESGARYLAILKWTAAPVTTFYDPEAFPGVPLRISVGGSYALNATQPTQPDNIAFSCAFAPDGTQLAVGHQGTGKLNIYSVSGDTHTLLVGQPDIAPANTVFGVEYRPDSRKLFTGGLAAITWYDVAGSVLTKLPDPVPQPSGTTHRVRVDPSGDYLSACHSGADYNSIYRIKADDTLEFQEGSSTPAAEAYDAAWTPDRKTYFLGLDSGASVMTYQPIKKYPACTASFQGRQVFAGSDENPLGVENSGVGWPTNFCERDVLFADDDAFRYTLKGDRLGSIRHLVSFRRRLYALTPTAPMAIYGDQDGVYRASPPPNAEPVTYRGCSKVRPVVIDNDLIFVEEGERSIIAIRHAADGNLQFVDLTKYSAHLFRGRRIVEMTMARQPDPTLYVAMSDGTLLTMAYYTDEDMIGWTRNDIQGALIRNIKKVPADGTDKIFAMIERTGADGLRRRFVCKLTDYPETDTTDWMYEANYLDLSIVYDGRNTSGQTMFITAESYVNAGQAMDLWTSESYFTASHVGKKIHMVDETGVVVVCTVTSIFNEYIAYIVVDKDIPEGLQNIPTTNWGVGYTIIKGLSHLEGEEVGAYGDGHVLSNPLNPDFVGRNLTVQYGAITLPWSAMVVVVGIPYPSDIKPLDLNDMSGSSLEKYKCLIKAKLRVENTKGVYIGRNAPSDDSGSGLQKMTANEGMPPPQLFDPSGGNLVGIENGGDYPAPVTGIISGAINPEWGLGHCFVRVVDPVPAAVFEITTFGRV